MILLEVVCSGSCRSAIPLMQNIPPFSFERIEMRKVYTKYCECDCGTLLPNADKGQRFIRGHTPGMLGIKHSEETKKKMSQAHIGILKGRVLSKETKKKMSESHKGRKFSIEHKKKLSEIAKKRHFSEETKKKMSKSVKGKNNPMFGKHHSPEICQKLGKLCKERFRGKKLTKEHKEKIRQAHLGMKFTEEHKENLGRSHASYMQKNKGKFKDTSIEIAIENKLIEAKLKYEKQKYIRDVGIVDFFLPDYNIVIEADGDYWHNLEGAQKKDVTRDFVAMFFYGYQTIRFWEHEIKDSSAKCLKKINKEIGRH